MCVVVVDTHLPRSEALAYVLPHFDELTHVVIRASSSVCWGLLFCLRKAYIFQEFAEGLLSICACWIFQNVHLLKGLCHKVNLPSCVARRPLCHKVNLLRCEARRRRFVMTCDTFGTGQTNILGLCYLFAPLKSLKSSHSTKLLHLLRRTIRYH